MSNEIDLDGIGRGWMVVVSVVEIISSNQPPSSFYKATHIY